MYCDTSKTHTDSSLWQIQDSKPRLLGYASKFLPEACKNYSVRELEMTGLALNIHLWKHLLLRIEFDHAVDVDPRALPYIMKSKNLPATGRIIRLLEHLSGYFFNLYYVKGKDMILCDYLSRIVVDKDDPGEVIPIPFNDCAQYMLHYPDMYQPCKSVVLQQTWVPNSLPMGANYVDYEPQGTEVIQACLQTTP